MDCVRCGAGTWAAVNSSVGPLCLGCLYHSRIGVTRVARLPRSYRSCDCMPDEACDVCYAAKDAALDASA
jgi:hypothetical protein